MKPIRLTPDGDSLQQATSNFLPKMSTPRKKTPSKKSQTITTMVNATQLILDGESIKAFSNKALSLPLSLKFNLKSLKKSLKKKSLGTLMIQDGALDQFLHSLEAARKKRLLLKFKR